MESELLCGFAHEVDVFDEAALQGQNSNSDENHGGEPTSLQLIRMLNAMQVMDADKFGERAKIANFERHAWARVYEMR